MNDVVDAAEADSPELIASLCGPLLAERAKENPVALILTELGDSYAASETPHTGPHKTFHGFRGDPLARLDYIFTTPDVRILAHSTFDDRPGGAYASDHYPVAVKAVVAAKGGNAAGAADDSEH